MCEKFFAGTIMKISLHTIFIILVCITVIVASTTLIYSYKVDQKIKSHTILKNIKESYEHNTQSIFIDKVIKNSKSIPKQKIVYLADSYKYDTSFILKNTEVLVVHKNGSFDLIYINKNKIYEFTKYGFNNIVTLLIIISFFLFFTPLILYYFLLDKPLKAISDGIKNNACDNNVCKTLFLTTEMSTIASGLKFFIANVEKERTASFLLHKTDDLSGLPNKKALEEKLESMTDNPRKNTTFALILLDIDDFRNINDLYGYQIGDMFLKKVAQDLKNAIRGYDLISRFGGDEFVIILNNFEDVHHILNILNRILKSISKPKIINDVIINATTSIGVSLYPHDTSEPKNLIKFSELAMYKAKENKNSYVFFTEQMSIDSIDYIETLNAVKNAIYEKNISVVFQPIVKNRNLVFFESLARLKINDIFLNPEVFIQIAEKNGFIYELGMIVCEKTFKAYRELKNTNNKFRFSINIAPEQIEKNIFLPDFKELLTQYQVDPGDIILELTERTFANDFDKMINIINELKDLGILIALDDFGTGYSSLSLLYEIKIDILKIDKSFVDKMHTEKGRIFIENILDLSKKINIEVVVEGIEHQYQLESFKNWNNVNIQGFFYSKPIEKDRIISFVKGLE